MKKTTDEFADELIALDKQIAEMEGQLHVARSQRSILIIRREMYHTSMIVEKCFASPAISRMTRNEAASYLRVSMRSLDRLVAEKEIPSTRIGGKRRGRVVFDRHDLDAYLKRQTN